MKEGRHHPPTPSSEEEGEQVTQRCKAPSSEMEGESVTWRLKAPSSSEEGVGGGGVTWQTLLKRAAHMRKNPTEPERRLWMELRDSRFYGFKFRRQVAIGWRIVDFFCPAKGLVIEIDGDTHDVARDQQRDVMLERETGFRVVRFINPEVMENLDGVLTALKIALEQRPDRWLNRSEHHPPALSSEEKGE